MRLNQISSSDTLTQSFISRMVQFATILTIAEFYSIIGNADYQRKSSSAKGGAFRALNSDYPDNQVNPAFANPTLKVFGDKVQVDRAHERRGADIASVRSADLLTFAETLGQEFQDKFINGDTANDVKEFDGLKKIIPAGQKITAAADGLQVLTGNDNAAKKSQQAFLELLDKLIRAVRGGAQAIMMDSKTWSRLNSIAREFIRWEKNEFGILIPYFGNVPILDSGYDKDGNLVIPHTETCGLNNDCTSIYAVRFGERSNLSCATNVGVEVKDLGLVGVHYTHAVELDCDLALLNDKAIARLEGIRIS